MLIELTREECYCSIPDFYLNIVKRTGTVLSSSAHFDYTKICVTKQVLNTLWDYYLKAENCDNLQIAALFLIVGPKANLTGRTTYCAEVEEGFV